MVCLKINPFTILTLAKRNVLTSGEVKNLKVEDFSVYSVSSVS